eukprot:CAMPEP_0118942414 /NCGR_PEP_ID=MMETSP1169-20130426/36106_1 /TAXON_ID=36882 /ORGANISM="Pyramimonas obovata, Strain CCMP722" /LENGTH=172 /DNA_ID=CAMNT_0006887425 /DNA_START=223 /DNA_END=737 /DNA_ORIENTATION=-
MSADAPRNYPAEASTSVELGNSISSCKRKDLRASVKWFNARKGFGFVVLEDGGEEMFVHGSVVTPGLTLRSGDEVVVDLMRTTKGEEVGAINMFAPREVATSDLAKIKVHETELAKQLQSDVQGLLLQLACPTSFADASRKLGDLADRLPQNYEFIRSSIFESIQVVDREVG